MRPGNRSGEYLLVLLALGHGIGCGAWQGGSRDGGCGSSSQTAEAPGQNSAMSGSGANDPGMGGAPRPGGQGEGAVFPPGDGPLEPWSAFEGPSVSVSGDLVVPDEALKLGPLQLDLYGVGVGGRLFSVLRLGGSGKYELRAPVGAGDSQIRVYLGRFDGDPLDRYFVDFGPLVIEGKDIPNTRLDLRGRTLTRVGATKPEGAGGDPGAAPAGIGSGTAAPMPAPGGQLPPPGYTPEPGRAPGVGGGPGAAPAGIGSGTVAPMPAPPPGGPLPPPPGYTPEPGQAPEVSGPTPIP